MLLPAYVTAILDSCHRRRLCHPRRVPGGGLESRHEIPPEFRAYPGRHPNLGDRFLVYQRARGLSPADSLLGGYRDPGRPSLLARAGLPLVSLSPRRDRSLSRLRAARRPPSRRRPCLRPWPAEHSATPCFRRPVISLLVWFTVSVSAFASVVGINRIEERNLFYVAPLFFIALLVWVNSACRGLGRAQPSPSLSRDPPGAPSIRLPAGRDCRFGYPRASPFWDYCRKLVPLRRRDAAGCPCIPGCRDAPPPAPMRFALVLPALVLAYLVPPTARSSAGQTRPLQVLSRTASARAATGSIAWSAQMRMWQPFGLATSRS